MTHKTLGELILADDPEAMSILKAWARGEYLTVSGHAGSFNEGFVVASYTYRLAPRDPIIDWSQIGAEILAFAMDENGIWFAYRSAPTFNGATWVQISGYVPASYWPKAFIPGHGIAAKDSLRLRPKEGE